MSSRQTTIILMGIIFHTDRWLAPLRVIAAQIEHFAKRHRRAGFGLELIHSENVFFFDPVLLAAGPDSSISFRAYELTRIKFKTFVVRQ